MKFAENILDEFQPAQPVSVPALSATMTDMLGDHSA